MDKEVNMTFLMLRPKKDYLDFCGKISYDNSIGAWSTIRFRSALIKRFPNLLEKQGSFGYRMVFLDSYEEIFELLKNNANSKEAVPILMWLFRE